MSEFTPGWAVLIIGGGFRTVDGPFADPENPNSIYPDYDIEYFLAEADGPPPAPVPLPAQVEAAAYAMLDSKQRVAILQISALQSRVDAINYMVNSGNPEHPDYIDPEDPDYADLYVAPTAADIAELPIRKTQLQKWNSYRAKLGKVITIVGWYQTPTWPVMPEPYTSETSAVAPGSPQLQ